MIFKNRFLTLIVALCFLLGMASAARAQAIVAQTSTAQMEQIFKQEGYSYTVDKDGDLIWKLDGYSTYLIIASDKKSIQFKAAFENKDTTQAKLDAWQRSKRYSKTFFDTAGDPILELDLDIAGGVTKARIIDFLKTCVVSFSAWRNEVL